MTFTYLSHFLLRYLYFYSRLEILYFFHHCYFSARGRTEYYRKHLKERLKQGSKHNQQSPKLSHVLDILSCCLSLPSLILCLYLSFSLDLSLALSLSLSLYITDFIVPMGKFCCSVMYTFKVAFKKYNFHNSYILIKRD